MYCKKCGCENTDDCKICIECGNSLEIISDNYRKKDIEDDSEGIINKIPNWLRWCLLPIVLLVAAIVASFVATIAVYILGGGAFYDEEVVELVIYLVAPVFIIPSVLHTVYLIAPKFKFGSFVIFNMTILAYTIILRIMAIAMNMEEGITFYIRGIVELITCIVMFFYMNKRNKKLLEQK